MDTDISSQADALKRCTKCGTEKPLSEYRFRSSKGRYRPRCRDCERVYIREHNQRYYQQNREKLIKSAKAWRDENLEQYDRWQKAYQRRKHREWKHAALAIYGERCACCGESQFEFLTLDHVDNDGHLHRQEIKGRNLYEWLATRGEPVGYKLQTLCFNCNFAKRYNGGLCPHQKSEGSTTIPPGSTAERPEAPDPAKAGEDIV